MSALNASESTIYSNLMHTLLITVHTLNAYFILCPSFISTLMTQNKQRNQCLDKC